MSKFDIIVEALRSGFYPVNHDMAVHQAKDVMEALGMEDDD